MIIQYSSTNENGSFGIFFPELGLYPYLTQRKLSQTLSYQDHVLFLNLHASKIQQIK